MIRPFFIPLTLHKKQTAYCHSVILQNPGIQKYVEFKDAVVLPIIFGRVSRTKYPTLGVLVYARAFLREQYGESAAHLVIG